MSSSEFESKFQNWWKRWRLSTYEFYTSFTFPQYVKIQFLFKNPSWSSWLLVSGCVSLFYWRKLVHFTITFSFSLPYFTSPLWVKLWYFFLYPPSFSFAVFFSLPFSNSYNIRHMTFFFVCFSLFSISLAKPPFLLILTYHFSSVPWKTFSAFLSQQLVPGFLLFICLPCKGIK